MQSTLLEIPSLLGISIEVYFIVFILAVPFFFLWRRIFRKFVKNKFFISVISWIVALITAPIAYGALIFLWVAIASYYPKKNFNTKEWSGNREKRYEFSSDIIKSNILIGKSKAEVRNILGDEGNKEQDNYWRYSLGFKPSLLGIDPDVLDIYFEEDKVVRVEQHET